MIQFDMNNNPIINPGFKIVSLSPFPFLNNPPLFG